jgi:glycosyltransferase involved in cell wall biosynthesis
MSLNPNPRVLLHSMGSTEWNGGQSYLQTVLHALTATFPNNLQLAHPGSSAVAESDEATPSIPLLRRWTPEWWISRLVRTSSGYDAYTDVQLKAASIDLVVFQSAFARTTIPSVGWLPDFQHRALPDLFSETERQGRDASFERVCSASTVVLLMSEFVRGDLSTYLPQYAGKSAVARPVSVLPPGTYDSHPQKALQPYGLPERFIYLPGQFWQHKNHRIVFEAVRQLAEQNPDVFLVCTGLTHDHREPAYASSLLTDLSTLRIRGRVALLGLVPRSVVLALVRQSICVVNPSLYEGYGLSVDEARSIGKQVVISDIPPHREQNPPGALYFQPQNGEQLAAQLQLVWRLKAPGPDLELETEARASYSGRVRAYGETLMASFQHALQADRPRGVSEAIASVGQHLIQAFEKGSDARLLLTRTDS